MVLTTLHYDLGPTEWVPVSFEDSSVSYTAVTAQINGSRGLGRGSVQVTRWGVPYGVLNIVLIGVLNGRWSGTSFAEIHAVCRVDVVALSVFEFVVDVSGPTWK